MADDNNSHKLVFIFYTLHRGYQYLYTRSIVTQLTFILTNPEVGSGIGIELCPFLYTLDSGTALKVGRKHTYVHENNGL